MRKFLHTIICAVAICFSVNAALPTIAELRAGKAILVHETEQGSFSINCADDAVTLFARPAAKIHEGKSIILKSLSPQDEGSFRDLVTELRSGEASRLFANGPVQGDALIQSVQLNIKFHNDTLKSGIPRFTVFVVGEDGQETPVGIARCGNAAKALFSREDISHALEQKGITVTGGVAEPCVLLLPVYQGLGIGSALSNFFFDVVAPLYKEMKVPFGLPASTDDTDPLTPWRWIFSTFSEANVASSKSLEGISGAVKLGIFEREQTPKEYWLIPVPSKPLSVERTELDGKITYLVSKASEQA